VTSTRRAALLKAGRTCDTLGGMSETEPSANATTAVDLSVDMAGIYLVNPMMTASGTCGYADEYADFVDLSKFGAFVTKSITREVRPGNEAYRIVETRAGMLNAIGLANVGLDAFLQEKVPVLEKLGVPIIVNVAGHSVEDYVHTAAGISRQPVTAAIELNVSCPNVKDGLTFGTNADLLRELVREVRGAMDERVKLCVKLSPNASDIVPTAAAAVEGGAQILSLTNTFTAMAIDVFKRRPRLANGTGGLSGPAIRPIAVYLTHMVYTKVARDAGVPIIGMGGIQNWMDAAEFVLAGASGLAVGTALFIDPATPVRVCEGLREWLTKLGCSSLREVIGTLDMDGGAPAQPHQ
jgi:dihydroorotate dehydrogenase (NAD+) catalytic subunit